MAVSVHDLPTDPGDRPWIRRALWTLAITVIIGGGAFAAYKMGIYGNRRAQEKLADSNLNKVSVNVAFVSVPAQLSKSRLDSNKHDATVQTDAILDSEVGIFAALQFGIVDGKPVHNYSRLQNPQDSAVLHELADALQSHQEQREKAWIKSIRSIRRESHPETNTETILIDAEFREPGGFIAQGSGYYLVEKVTTLVSPQGQSRDYQGAAGEKQAIRLPGVYTAAQRRAWPELPCVTGIDSPIPEPGQPYKSPDAIAGLELAQQLAQYPYSRQIAAVDMTNFNGRIDANQLAPFIVLQTIFANPANPPEPTLIRWGRPIGEEGFYEIHAPVKLRYLTELFMKYNRIDAGEAHVDLRFDQPEVPMATTPPHSDAAPAQTPPTTPRRV